jgi:hypothetical protein
VLELLNPGGTFRVRDGVLLDPAPAPLAKAESLENLAASEAGASILREFCRPGCRSVQLQLLDGVSGAVPCVLSVLADDEEALVGVRVLQLDTPHQENGADGAAEGLDCGSNATVGLEHLVDFQALEASLLGTGFTAIAESESEASTAAVEAALEEECQELRLKLEAAERRNAKLTAELRAAAAEQERSRTAPLVLKLAKPKQAGRSSEKVATAVQTDSTPPPPPPMSTEPAGRKTNGAAGFAAGSHPRWLAGILNAAFESQVSKNLPPPPFEAESAGGIGKLLKKRGLAYDPKLGWHPSPPPRRPISKVAPEGEDASTCAESDASDTTDEMEWAKSVQPQRKYFTKRTTVVCPDPPTTLPEPI